VAPATAGLFKALAAGTLVAPCAASNDAAAVTSKGALVKRRAAGICEADQDIPVAYASSRVWRVLRGRRIDLGQVAGAFTFRAAPALPDEATGGLSHDAAGLLTLQKGGGTFDFSILPAPNAAEFDGNSVVFGRVLEGLDVVHALDDLAVADAAPFYPTAIKGEGKASSKASRESCYYGSKQLFCNQNRPLQKAVVTSARVL